MYDTKNNILNASNERFKSFILDGTPCMLVQGMASDQGVLNTGHAATHGGKNVGATFWNSN